MVAVGNSTARDRHRDGLPNIARCRLGRFTSHVAGAFLDAGEIDEIRLFLAPLVLGGRSARATIEGEGAESIADAVRALTLECETIGEDLLASARLREW